MDYKTVEIDFSSINDLNTMHEKLKEVFGFPDFYGSNIHALIDCLTSLRAKDGMIGFELEETDSFLLIKTFKLSLKSEIIIKTFISAIEAVNRRYEERTQKPVIYILNL